MSVYVATQCLRGVRTVQEGIDKLLALGLADIELSGPHGRPDAGLTDRLPAARYVLHNYFPAPEQPFFLNLASDDGRTRARSIQHVRAALDLCARIGAPLYTVHGGFKVDPSLDLRFSPGPGMQSSRAALQRYIDAIGPLADYARTLGVTLGVENNVMSPQNLARSPQDPFLLFLDDTDFRDLFAAVDCPALGTLLDVGHLNVTARTFGWDRVEVFRKMPRIVAFHLHDNDGTADQHLPITADSWFLPEIARGGLAHVPRILETERIEADALLRSVRLAQATTVEARETTP